MRNRVLAITGIILLSAGLMVIFSLRTYHSPAAAAPEIFASPVHAGCYIAGPSDCRIHVEPFTIDLATGTKLVFFQLVAFRSGHGGTTIYDFRPDLSNPVPPSGDTYTPSLVAQDYAAICGETYQISLQGQDTGDPNPLNLGLTGNFTCPTSVP